MIKVNIPLLRKAVEWVEEQDKLPAKVSQWNQSYWAEENECRSAYCVAGYVLSLTQPEFVRNWLELPRNSQSIMASEFSFLATQELGIHEVDADALFDESNTADDVRNIAEDIAGEPL